MKRSIFQICTCNKALLLVSLILIPTITVFSQGQPNPLPNQKWNTVGNTATSSDFIGTTNYTPLVFKTNNRKAFEIGPNGDIFMSNLSGPVDGIIKHDHGGKIDHIPFNNSFTQVLSSSGVWKEISTFTGLEISGNNIIQTTSGNFGIGTSSPQAKLDINGNVKISGELLSQQGIKFNNSSGIFYSNAGGISTLSYGMDSYGARGIPCAAPPSSWVNMFGGILQVYGTEPNSGLLNFQTWGGGSSIDASIEGNVAPGRLLLNYFCGNSTFINTGTNGGDVVMTTNANGKVGIGTEPLTDKLEIGNGNIFIKGQGNFTASQNEAFVFLGDHNHYIKSTNGKGVTINTYGAGDGIFLSQGTGNVGVGTLTPTEKLEVAGNIKLNWNQIIFKDPNHGLGYFYVYTNTGKYATKIIDGPVLYGYNGGGLGTNQEGFKNLALTWSANGNVGIGIDENSNSSNYRLAVNGIIGAKEVKIETALTPWPDYVFGNDYKLMGIKELEQYLNTNKHLPNIPSAKEVDNNGGIMLGDFQTKLLEKVEELTLYLIEQSKIVAEQNKRIEELEKR